MQYRALGRTGIEVSALGYEAMRLPIRLDGQSEADVHEDKAIECLHRAFDLGVNYVDTALGYNGGFSEVMVGKAIAGRRDQIIVSTKNPYKESDTGEFATMTVQYNLLQRKNEEPIAHAHKRGIGVIIMGPIGGGRLIVPPQRIVPQARWQIWGQGPARERVQVLRNCEAWLHDHLAQHRGAC